jgi:uncharacterized protein
MILEEYLRVAEDLGRDFPGVDVSAIIALVAAKAEVCSPIPIRRVCRDPDDDKFIACALGGEADVIVTGDRDLLVLRGYQGVRISKVSEFLRGLNAR